MLRRAVLCATLAALRAIADRRKNTPLRLAATFFSHKRHARVRCTLNNRLYYSSRAVHVFNFKKILSLMLEGKQHTLSDYSLSPCVFLYTSTPRALN